jgi:hypothetical protein
MSKYFAVRIGSQVEIRRAKRAPKIIKSTLVRRIGDSTIMRQNPDGDWQLIIEPRTYTLKQTYCKGGNTLGICNYYKFYNLFGRTASFSSRRPFVEINEKQKNIALRNGVKFRIRPRKR